MEQNFELIASDLDGTLLLGTAQELQPNTCEIVEKFLDDGIKFVACSGRRYKNLKTLFAPIKDRIDYVCDNGCLAYVNGELVFQAAMEKELGRAIIRKIRETKDCEIFVSCAENCYIQADRPEFIRYMREVVRFDVEPIEDILNLPEDYMKISLYEKDGLTDTNYLKEIFGDKCTMQTGGAAWFDTVPKNINKRTAFEKILERLKISPEKCVMFGDNDNDVEVLKYVGTPIAMKSAKENVRQLGKYTTDTVENFLIKLLEKQSGKKS